MKTIKTIEQLELSQGFLQVNNQRVMLQQGSIDGACGPYCLFMALIILEVISYDEVTNLWLAKGHTRFGKMVKKMRDFDTLFSNGTHLHELEDIILASYKTKLKVETTSKKGKDLIAFTVSQLKLNKPTIVGVKGVNLYHWLLAIGFEEENGKATKLFFLDPSEQVEINYWNAVIDVENTLYGRYSYPWLNYENRKVSFEDGMSIDIK
jgi:hypothetical protein